MRRRDILFAIILGLGIWQALVWITGAPHFILPSPWRVAQAAYKSRVIIFDNAWITALEVFLGLLLGTLFGCGNGCSTHTFQNCRAADAPDFSVYSGRTCICSGSIAHFMVWLWHWLKSGDDRAYYLFSCDISVSRWTFSNTTGLSRLGRFHGGDSLSISAPCSNP